MTGWDQTGMWGEVELACFDDSPWPSSSNKVTQSESISYFHVFPWHSGQVRLGRASGSFVVIKIVAIPLRRVSLRPRLVLRGLQDLVKNVEGLGVLEVVGLIL